MDDCVDLSKELAIRVSNELEIPTFLYGAAATSPDRNCTFSISEGQYEGFKERLENGGPISQISGLGNGQMLYRNLVRLLLVRATS